MYIFAPDAGPFESMPSKFEKILNLKKYETILTSDQTLVQSQVVVHFWMVDGAFETSSSISALRVSLV